MGLVVLIATALVALAVDQLKAQPCTSTSEQNITCAAGDACCSGWKPLCFDPTTSKCCNSSAQDEVIVCPSNSTCCGGTCCDSALEQCCSTQSDFCCAKDAVCCGEFCCGPDQTCCGGVCCDNSNQVCTQNTCEYITPPPSFHPGPYANWSTVWSFDSASYGPCFLVSKGVLCRSMPDQLKLLSPRYGSPLWTMHCDNIDIAVPLSDTLLFAGNSLVDMTNGTILWSGNASTACWSPVVDRFFLSASLDGASNVIVSCGTRKDDGNGTMVQVFGLSLEDGSTRFTYTLRVKRPNYAGQVVGVAQHRAVVQGDKEFIALNTLTGDVAWRHPFGNFAQAYPADTALVFTDGANLTALNFLTGALQWTMPYPGPGAPLAIKIKRSEEVLAASTNANAVIFINVRSGEVVFETSSNLSFVWPGFAFNAKYLWVYTDSNVTAISLDDVLVSWTVPISCPGGVFLYPGSANNTEVYMHETKSALVKLSASGVPLQTWNILPTTALFLTQYDADKVVVVVAMYSVLAFSIP